MKKLVTTHSFILPSCNSHCCWAVYNTPSTLKVLQPEAQTLGSLFLTEHFYMEWPNLAAQKIWVLFLNSKHDGTAYTKLLDFTGANGDLGLSYF